VLLGRILDIGKKYGIEPTGLGARDTLRIEASFPLYGHELGIDLDDKEFPIFALKQARYAGIVSFAKSKGKFIGHSALQKQRKESDQIYRGELNIPLEERILKRLVQPIAIIGSERPTRTGYKVFHDGKEVGYVTSGSTLPHTRFYGKGITAIPSNEDERRSIGLAYINSDIMPRTDRPVELQVKSDKGFTLDAILVNEHAIPAAPYVRPMVGFQAPSRDRISDDNIELEQLASELGNKTAENSEWRQKQCINLIPSEITPSPLVRELSIADPAGRYNEHKHLKALFS